MGEKNAFTAARKEEIINKLQLYYIINDADGKEQILRPTST